MALFLRVAQGHDFGVGSAGTLRMALAQQLAIGVGDDAADMGIRRAQGQALMGKRQGLGHVGVHGADGSSRVNGYYIMTRRSGSLAWRAQGAVASSGQSTVCLAGLEAARQS